MTDLPTRIIGACLAWDQAITDWREGDPSTKTDDQWIAVEEALDTTKDDLRLLIAEYRLTLAPNPLVEVRQELLLLQKIMDLSARLVTRALQAPDAKADRILQADYQAIQDWGDRFGGPDREPGTVHLLDALLPPDLPEPSAVKARTLF